MQELATQVTLSSKATFNVKALQALYRHFESSSLAELENFYHSTAVFIDPVHRLTGLSNIKNYFAHFCSAELQCRFEFLSEVVTYEPNGQGAAFMQWNMHYSHPNGGKDLLLEGASLIKFDSKIFFHQDYYDMGAMVYQQIPWLGWLIKKINLRLAGSAP